MNWKLLLIFVVVSMSSVSCGRVTKESDLQELFVDAEDVTQDAKSSNPLAYIKKWDDEETWNVAENVLKLAPFYKTGKPSLDPYENKLSRELATQVGRFIFRSLKMRNQVFVPEERVDEKQDK